MTVAAAESTDASTPPYVLITTDGHRIDVAEKPAPQGERLALHLFPSGDPAVYPAKGIDWPATEKFNAPPPPKAAAAARSTMPSAGTPELAAPGHGRSAARTDGALTLTLIGGGHARVTTPAAPGGEAPAAPGAAKPADPKETASLLASLAKEMGDLQQVRAGFVESRAKLQEEMSALEARAANAPPAGLDKYESPAKKALGELRARMQALEEQIAPIDRRILEIRVRQSELAAPGE